jgi:hypothetical protein
VHQRELGISVEQLSAAITDANLRRWWVNYLEKGPGGVPGAHYPELVLSAPLGSHRLLAKYDLLAVQTGQRAVILDWKTYRRRPEADWLAERMQTRVYPYLLVRAGSHLNEGQPFEPHQVEMVYWFANFAEDPVSFLYGPDRYGEDEAYLNSLVEEIENLAETEFELTADKQRCDFCPYRSLCERGVLAGDLGEAMEGWDVEGDFEISLDFDQIAEIEY